MSRSFAKRFPFAVGIAMLVAILSVSASSRADGTPRLTMDWAAFLANGAELLRRNSEAPAPDSVDALSRQLQAPQLGSAWFGVAPRVSLVARDWGGAKRLAGAQLSLTDAMRLSRSSRMVVSRIRLGEGTRFTPFAQVGLGQWRVDTDIMPQMLRDTELAAQFGGGFEVRMTGTWQIAVEHDFTVLYRESHEPQNWTTPRMSGTFLASRVEF